MATMRKAALWTLRCAVASGVVLSTMTGGYAADSDPTSSQQIQELKQQLADQQKQIEELRMLLVGQQKKIESVSNSAPVVETPVAVQTPVPAPAPAAPAVAALAAPKPIGEVASLTPILPALPAAAPRPVAAPLPPVPQAAKPDTNPCEANPEGQTPAFLRLGSTCLIPIGFMDLTGVWRDKNAGSGMGSNFGSIPYNNTVNGNLSEFRFTPQNSRIGFRFDGDWKGAHFIGYNEFDFNGTSGSNGIAVSNGAFVPRLRLFWVDVRKGKLEYLVGQSWSMMTPNRVGLSALPGNLFYTQVVDINYMAGLTWTRQPGMRFLYHPSEKVTWGFSAENPDQYAGGSAGGSTITYPAAFASYANAQLDVSQNVSSGQNILNQPTVTPDFISKLAFDPSSRLHIEIGGIERNFKVVNPTSAATLGQHFSKSGGGAIFGINVEAIKNFRVMTTNYWSDGGGRYLFGQAPDLVVRNDGSLSLVHSGATIDGFEARVHPKLLLYGYYGAYYIQKNTGYDVNGTTHIGYGFPGSANSQNKAIQEVTFGFNQTIWSSPRYGAINAMGQWEWLTRDPWYVAVGAPKNTHDNTIYFNMRYTLPGNMPNF